MKFCIVDVSNLVHRAKHSVSRRDMSRNPYDPFGDLPQDDPDDLRVGLILTVVFSGLLNTFQKFDSDHCVAAFDSRSWRRDFMPEYKANRRDRVKTPQDVHDHELITRTIDELRDFLKEYTNVTVLEAPGAEADDFIGRWVQLHDDPAFSHVIMSADGDFKQLVRDEVDLYNPMTHVLYTMDGVFHQDGKKVKSTDRTVDRYGQVWKVKLDKKTKVPMEFDPEWELFEKCIRGDVSDNIRSAWPRVSTVRMKKAFYGSTEDWNNFINSTWGTDGEKKSVRELYDRNKTLIDLSLQPEKIISVIDDQIESELDKELNRMVGSYFAKFCSKYSLSKLSQRADHFTNLLSLQYS